MFPFNLLLSKAKSKKINSKYFEPLFSSKYENYKPPKPSEIRKMTEKMSRCPKCHFLIFDNYWANDIENVSERLCPTCGERV